MAGTFYQITLSRNPVKYCGVTTPFQGIPVYALSNMGMPGSETALKQLMSQVLADLLKEGIIAKIADNLYCGVNSPGELLLNCKKFSRPCTSVIFTFLHPK